MPNASCNLEDNLIATVGSAIDYCKLVADVSKVLDDKEFAIKLKKMPFFVPTT